MNIRPLEYCMNSNSLSMGEWIEVCKRWIRSIYFYGKSKWLVPVLFLFPLYIFKSIDHYKLNKSMWSVVLTKHFWWKITGPYIKRCILEFCSKPFENLISKSCCVILKVKELNANKLKHCDALKRICMSQFWFVLWEILPWTYRYLVLIGSFTRLTSGFYMGLES